MVSVSICLLVCGYSGVGVGAFSGVWAAYFATPLTLSLNLFPSGSTWITSLAARIVAFTETAAPGALKIVPFGEA